MNKMELLDQYNEICTRSIRIENFLCVLIRSVNENVINEGAYLREAGELQDALIIAAEYQARTTDNMYDLEVKLTDYIKNSKEFEVTK